MAENEIVSDLIAADVSNKLKLALLHDTEANRLTKRVDSVVNFYGWDGKKIIGPYPEKSNNCLQNFTQIDCSTNFSGCSGKMADKRYFKTQKIIE